MRLCNFIKNEALPQVFSCQFCEISKNTFSYRTPPVAASVYGWAFVLLQQENSPNLHFEQNNRSIQSSFLSVCKYFSFPLKQRKLIVFFIKRKH